MSNRSTGAVGLGRKRANMPKPEDKPFAIPKLLVWEAWRRVRANQGAPGVDGQDLAQFEADLRNNLYKVWNRMSSGSYFPPPVLAVEIPKPHGDGVRVLGVPTIADRVAQTVVAMHLEERADHRFHPDSYGYRPGKSAHQALAACRQRCWKYDWAIDLDVQKFFDEVPWDLVLRAVKAVTDSRWVLLYVERWLAAPFERYADDAIVHCKTRRQAEYVLGGIAARMSEVGLGLHPGQDADRLLQGRSAPGGARAHLVHLPRVRLPGTGGAQQERPELHRVLACDQPRGAQGQRRRAPQDADPPAHRPVAGRPGAMAEPHRRRVDQLLQPVLPDRARSPPQARQRLPEALGREEIQAAADPQVLQSVVGQD